ncbi:MAG: PilZ domain-containing protein [Candidatus Omnitrophica bacterium]|nr:PilZ domain-containing protein [Candidatus Omnitrophota bacterium]
MKVVTKKNERRKAIRVDTPKSVSNCRLFSAESEGRFQFTVWPIKNISTHGISIKSDEQVSQGALAFLNIDLDIIMKTVGVIAKVVWCQEREQGYEIGLNFSWWPKEDDRELMIDFVKGRISCEEIL